MSDSVQLLSYMLTNKNIHSCKFPFQHVTFMWSNYVSNVSKSNITLLLLATSYSYVTNCKSCLLFLQPVLDILIYVRELAATIGPQGPTYMIGYLVLSGLILTRWNTYPCRARIPGRNPQDRMACSSEFLLDQNFFLQHHSQNEHIFSSRYHTITGIFI